MALQECGQAFGVDAWAFGASPEPPAAPTFTPSVDQFVIEAKQGLVVFFSQNPNGVYYERQLEVLFEDTHFHWVTRRALHELRREAALASDVLPLGIPEPGEEGTFIRFYRLPANRYWKRDAARIVKLVREYSTPTFGHALGDHGETLFDAGLGRQGFRVDGEDVREWNGVRWQRTNHDLDRVYSRDGVSYGAEIKNSLRYIQPDELGAKLAMCRAFGVRPLFIVRMLPKTYVNDIVEAGGFALIFKYQLYPFGWDVLAERVRAELGLPTFRGRVAEKTVNRFLQWHLGNL